MGIALYRKYRSRSLEDIVGQEQVTDVLSRALKKHRVAHAYLFTGPRGTGKTSIARILAHEINDLPYDHESSHLDIIEIDAASNNGVDDIRDLRDKVQLAPNLAKKKVYIIDEVHMLSKAAFNALLKTLEEPPEHVVFILATTDVDKLPATIISRTQRYTFKRASLSDLVKNLKRIVESEAIKIDDEALDLIAQHSDGSYRDSVSLLDQLSSISDKKITAKNIEASLGLAPQSTIKHLLESLKHEDFDKLTSELSELENRGIQASVIASQLMYAIKAGLKDSPELVSILDKLLEVGHSSIPNMKLLSVLSSSISPKKSVTKNAPALVALGSSIEIPELSEKAIEPHPKDEPANSKSSADLAPRAAKVSLSTEPFDWERLVEATKHESIGLSTVLGKCSAISEDDTLTIYARNDFYKKKLDNPRYRQILNRLLLDIDSRNWTISFVPGLAPPKNSRVAAVTAIMGGGEEVCAALAP